MKKLIFLLFWFSLLANDLKSQNLDHNALVSYLQTNTKLNTTDKIIAVNFWSANSKSSRDANVDLNNTCNIFKNAKLKGGSKGMIGILICLDKDEVAAHITLKKDGITYLITINASELSQTNLLADKTETYSVIFDSNGSVIAENLQNTTFLNSIRNLITR
jgi:hypothetical protein